MEPRLKPSFALIAAACAVLCACSIPRPDTLAQAGADCAKGARHEEVRFYGSVLETLGTRLTRSGAHEGFIVLTAAHKHVRVEDNTDITGAIPLRLGEPVAVQGQYACDDGVVHWTHRDPEGRHWSGFITAGGHTYE